MAMSSVKKGEPNEKVGSGEVAARDSGLLVKSVVANGNGGAPTVSRSLLSFVRMATALDLADAVVQGVAYQAFQGLVEDIGESERRVSDWIKVSLTTLHRRKGAGRLGADESERVLRLARVFELATGVFDGDKAVAKRWLNTPASALRNATPLECVATEFGAEEVSNLLLRIEYGVYS